MKKCPICNSSRLKSNGKEIKCDKCGWINSDKKNACFVEFSTGNRGL